MRVARRVLLDRDQARDAGALRYWRRTRWPGPFGRDERDVDLGGRLDLAVVDREAVAEQQQVAGGDPVADLALPDLAVQLVGHEHLHEVAAAGGLGDRQHLEAAVARLLRPSRESSRRPTTTFTPESFRFRAWAWPWEPKPMIATVLPSRRVRSASSS